MTQIELIQYYSEQLKKAISSHGADSDYTTNAFFKLRAAKMGLTQSESSEWTESEVNRLHAISLDKL